MPTLKVSLFGASGLLGADLWKIVPPGVKLKCHGGEVDITDRRALARAITSDTPDWIVNMAAYNDVDRAEDEPEKAFAVNAIGAHNLADFADAWGVPIIHGSTDYVFSGGKTVYAEDDDPDPVNAYGRSKAEGERFVRASKRHYVLRMSSLFGTARPNHASRALEALKDGWTSPFHAATDLYCSPSYTRDLAGLIYRLIEANPPFGVYHLVHRGNISRYSFARRLLMQAGGRDSLPIYGFRAHDIGLRARRPLRVHLSTFKWESAFGPLPTISDGIQGFLDEVSSTKKEGEE